MALSRSVHTASCPGAHHSHAQAQVHSALLHKLFEQELFIFARVRQKHHKGQVPNILGCAIPVLACVHSQCEP